MRDTAKSHLRSNQFQSGVSYAAGANGASIAYALLGPTTSRVPRIVVSSGLMLGCLQLQEPHDAPTDFLRTLSERAQVLIFDPAGKGLSSGAPRAWNPAEPNEIDAVTDAAGWEHYGVFAVFTDGPAAIAHAARRQERVTDLVLWCALSSMQAFRASKQGAILADIASRDTSLFLRTFAHVSLGWSDGSTARWMAELLEADGFDVVQFESDLQTVNAEAAMGDVLARTLVVHGRAAPLIDLDQSRSIVQRWVLKRRLRARWRWRGTAPTQSG